MRIRELRQQASMSKSDLVRVMSLNQSAVAKWESGQNKPTAEMQMKLADLFQCLLDYLCGWEPPDATKAS